MFCSSKEIQIQGIRRTKDELLMTQTLIPELQNSQRTKLQEEAEE